MGLRKSAAVAAIPTEDGHAIIGGRVGQSALYDELTVSGRPKGGNAQPVTAGADPLPSLAVARQVVGREIGRLRSQAEDLERRISAHPGAFQGNANPYLASVVQAHQAMTLGYKIQLEVVRDELAELEALDGHAVQQFARDHMATHPGPVR